MLKTQCLQILDTAERTLDMLEETPKEQLGSARATYVGQVISAVSQVEELLKESRKKAPPMPQAPAYQPYAGAPAAGPAPPGY